jgi:hypothetical protein
VIRETIESDYPDAGADCTPSHRGTLAVLGHQGTCLLTLLCRFIIPPFAAEDEMTIVIQVNRQSAEPDHRGSI